MQRVIQSNQFQELNDQANKFLESRQYHKAFRLFKKAGNYKLSIYGVKELLKKNKTNPLYLQPEIGSLYSFAKYLAQTNQFHLAVMNYDRINTILLELDKKKIDLPIPILRTSLHILMRKIEYDSKDYFIIVNDRFISLINDSPILLKDSSGGSIARLELISNGELVIKGFGQVLELIFNEGIPFKKLLLENPHARIILSGKFNNALKIIDASLSELINNSEIVLDKLILRLSDSNFTVEKQGSIRTTHDLTLSCLALDIKDKIHSSRCITSHTKTVAMGADSKLHANKAIRINADELKELRGDIITDDILYGNVKNAITLNGNAYLSGKKGIILCAKKMVMEDKTEIVSNNTKLTFDEFFSTAERAVIKDFEDELGNIFRRSTENP